MITQKTDSERFVKMLMKVNSTSDKNDKIETPSSHNSFLKDMSIRSEKSTKYGSNIDTRIVPSPPMD